MQNFIDWDIRGEIPVKPDILINMHTLDSKRVTSLNVRL
jgi:hypothetical protein